MKLGFLFLIIGIALIAYLSKIKIKKSFLSSAGIVLGIFLFIYGLILSLQPDDYIEFTKTTISSDVM